MSSVIPPKGTGAEPVVRPPSSAAGLTCMLLVGDRVVLRASSPPEAEYAMFELAEIELRASEPGSVREHGYRTTARRALERLAQLGATPAVARECALAMTPTLAEAYARGSAALRVARHLGPVELLQSSVYDGATHAYHGTFVDLPTLARDLELPGAGAALQALYLAVLLSDEAPDTAVFLQTEAWTKPRKSGERTYKRPNLTAMSQLPRTLGDLARKGPRPHIVEHLARAEVMAFVRARADAATDEGTRELYASLERGLSTRDMPERGPLADRELWAIEARLDAGDLGGVMMSIDAAESSRGRTPGTTYLRGRASLALRLEPPKLIAERMSALALSMTSFQELGLLAAEAWLEAGEPRRAMPYARDLVEAPQVDEGLQLRAQRLLARAVGAAPHEKTKTIADSMPSAPKPPTAPPRHPSLPPIVSPDPDTPRSYPPGQSRTPTTRGDGVLRPSTSPGLGFAWPAPPSEPQEPCAPPAAPRPAIAPPPEQRRGSLPPAARPTERPARASVVPSAGPPPLELELTPPPMSAGASFTFDVPPLEAETPKAPSVAPRATRRPLAAVEERRPSNVPDPRAEPESEPKMISQSARPKPERGGEPRGRSSGPAARPPSDPTRPAVAPTLEPASTFDDEATLPRRASVSRRDADPSGPAVHPLMMGASLPPYSSESPAPPLPRAPLLPKTGPVDELAEHLSLPPGISTDVKLDVLPRSVLEARVQFTLLARELGLDYRLKRGISLRSDVSGLEAIQAVLLEIFPDRVVKTPEDAYELRRHGAFVAEILARRLDAEWIDISPSELGRWAMIVPPDTRVWPFGRVARLIHMGHRERDLVSYFFELSSRARRL